MRTRLVALGLCLAAIAAAGCRAVAEEKKPGLAEQFRQHLIRGRMSSPLNPKSLSEAELGPVRTERVRITPEEGFDAVVLINRPKAPGRYPVVIVQHFLGATKDHLVFLPLYNQLASKGFLVAAIDGRFRGERTRGSSLDAAMIEALRSGKGNPFLIDTAYDVMRLIDYLTTRPDVDASRIGMTGFSEGGIITWMVTAADPRVKVAAPFIGVTTFAEALKLAPGQGGEAQLQLLNPVLSEYAKQIGEREVNEKVLRGAWEKLVPGMLDRYDAPAVLPEIAPRPLLIQNHELDELFPLDGARKAVEAAKSRYAMLNAADRLEFKVMPGLKHAAFNLQEVSNMVGWMEKWLKEPPASGG